MSDDRTEHRAEVVGDRRPPVRAGVALRLHDDDPFGDAIAVEHLRPVEAVERKWAGLRTFAPDRRMKFGYDPEAPGFFWCVGQGGMGIQTAPAASLLCAALIRGVPMPIELAGVSPADFAPVVPERRASASA